MRAVSGPRANSWVVGGWDPRAYEPLPLTNGHFLRVSIKLFREPYNGGHRLKVEASSYQYQSDDMGKHWIFRYDYVRDNPNNPHPESHLHVQGDLHADGALPKGKPLGRVHFPSRRMPIEAVIRLLIREFGVPARTKDEFWEPLLAESEDPFREIAHETR